MNSSMIGLIRELWESGDRDSAIKAAQQLSLTDPVGAYDLLAELFLNVSLYAETFAEFEPILQEGIASGSISCKILSLFTSHLSKQTHFDFSSEEMDVLLDGVEQANYVALKLTADLLNLEPDALERYKSLLFDRLERSKANQNPELDYATVTIVQAAFSSENNTANFSRFIQYLRPLLKRGNTFAFSLLWSIRYFSDNDPQLEREVEQWAADMEQMVPGISFYIRGFCCCKANDLKGAALNWQKGYLQNNVHCTVLYAQCLVRGLGVQQDFDTASELLTPLVRENVDAARLAAYIAMFGQAEPDLDQAFLLLERHLASKDRLEEVEKNFICEDLAIYSIYQRLKRNTCPKAQNDKLVKLLESLDPRDKFLSGYKYFAAYHGLIDLGKSREEILTEVLGCVMQQKLDTPMRLILVDYTGMDCPGPNAICLADLANKSVIRPTYRYELAVKALRYAQECKNEEIIGQMLSLIDALATDEQQVEAKFLHFAQKLIFENNLHDEGYGEYTSLVKQYPDHPVGLYIFLEGITKVVKSKITPDFHNLLVSNLQKVAQSGNWYAIMSVAKLLERLSASIYGSEFLEHWYNKLIEEAESGSFLKQPDENLKQLAALNNCGSMAFGC